MPEHGNLASVSMPQEQLWLLSITQQEIDCNGYADDTLLYSSLKPLQVLKVVCGVNV